MKTDLIMMGKHLNMAPRHSRRRLVVLIYVVFAALIVAALCGYANLLLIAALVISGKILGGRMTHGGLIPSVDRGDEREKNRRDHAYFLAYWWFDLTLFPAIIAAGIRYFVLPIHPHWNPDLRAFLHQIPVGLFVACGVLYYTLPQAILLWTEPDMEQL